ncbi:DUF1830 domain-containing protein [Spirulina sp. CS-785/01]|uniref:DUF1830 domain-containing protein n=1 Tax=Spirulina sp. CS-785/01 TaxID=3021716 RepID=UPI0023309BEA|nr:DUF1830 domain-containing protein [Spirulina sp. CS-785/01]MDB9315763.1 DUF1830 domain-containing protein [Spirulina sp. CS-785/01]
MAQIFDPIPNNASNPILCCYVNATSQIQIARITNIPNWYFERVVFPGQRLVFETLPAGLLEIHTGMMASAILSDTISCKELQVSEDGDPQETGPSEATDDPLEKDTATADHKKFTPSEVPSEPNATHLPHRLTPVGAMA